MAKTIFVSIVHEDKKDVIHTLLNWQKQNFIQNIDFIFEEEDKRPQGGPEIERYLKNLMDKSQVIVFIIGKDTHNHDWISWEYSYAQTKPSTKMVYINLKGSSGLPEIFPNVQPIEFNLENFKSKV